MKDSPEAGSTGATPYPDAGAWLGPYPAATFRVVMGADESALLTRAARFYFAPELVAVPGSGVPIADYTCCRKPMDDVCASRSAPAAAAYPQLIWIASRELLRHARLSQDGARVLAQGRDVPLRLYPRHPLNRSWFDSSSAQFLSARPLAMRGEWADGAFVARSFWPEDFRLDVNLAKATAPLPTDLVPALRKIMRAPETPATDLAFRGQLLWERPGGARNWHGQSVIALIANGAQGDDDEAWGGHFAVCTGRVGAAGEINELLVNNFYSLDVESEKGILAAPVPLDRYLADLNSGQSWYRPSWLLVAVLRDPRASLHVQGAFNRVYPQFWRHRLRYGHATMNCTGISIDTLRALGLDVAPRPQEGRVAAWFAFPHALFKYKSLEHARLSYEYLVADPTRLFPAAAFEEGGATLARIAAVGPRDDEGELARMLAADVDALAVLKIPQLPSSRRRGTFPVLSPWEYQRNVPRDPKKLEIVPVPKREFPAALRDADLPLRVRRPSDLPLLVWGGVVAGVTALLVWLAVRLFQAY